MNKIDSKMLALKDINNAFHNLTTVSNRLFDISKSVDNIAFSTELLAISYIISANVDEIHNALELSSIEAFREMSKNKVNQPPTD